MNQFKKTVQLRSNLYNEYTSILNSFLNLTPKQCLVLAKLFELTETTSITRKFLDKENRKEIEETCSIDECNLSTYLTLFKQKDILIKVKDQWILNYNIVPNISNNQLNISFIITSNNGNSNS